MIEEPNFDQLSNERRMNSLKGIWCYLAETELNDESLNGKEYEVDSASFTELQLDCIFRAMYYIDESLQNDINVMVMFEY